MAREVERGGGAGRRPVPRQQVSGIHAHPPVFQPTLVMSCVLFAALLMNRITCRPTFRVLETPDSSFRTCRGSMTFSDSMTALRRCKHTACPRGVERFTSSEASLSCNGMVYVRHCKVALAQQVFPAFLSPAPGFLGGLDMQTCWPLVANFQTIGTFVKSGACEQH
jgi:hypothetical protein